MLESVGGRRARLHGWGISGAILDGPGPTMLVLFGALHDFDRSCTTFLVSSSTLS